MKKNFLFGTLTVLLAGFWFGGASLAMDSYGVKDWNDSYFNGFAVHEYHAQTGTMTIDGDTDTITFSDLKLVDEGDSSTATDIGQLGIVFLVDGDDAANLNLARTTKYKNGSGAFSAAPTTISNEGGRWQYAFWLWITPDLVKEALTDNDGIIENTFIVSNGTRTKRYTVNIDVNNYTQYSAPSTDDAYLRNKDFFDDVQSPTEITRTLNSTDYKYGRDKNPVLFQVVNGKVVVEDGKQVINSIEFANVVKPVAGNQATTGGITVTEGITIKDAVWTEKLPYKRPVSVPPVLTSVTSASTLQIASESTTTSEEFTGTFEEGKEYVLNVKYDYDDGYTGSSVTYKVNGADATDELEGDGDIASFKFTAEAKPAQSNMSGGGGGSRGGGSSNSNTSAKSDEKATDTAKADEQKADEAKADETKSEEAPAEGTVADAAPAPMTEAQAVAKFGQEQIDAYKWAHDKGITTMDTVEDARLDQPLTRAELAKMMVVYMAKIAKKSPVVTGTVSYPDVKAEEIGDELVGYIQLAYQFQIMGVDANGNPIEEFMPNALVTRGEYATVFSRVLFGSLFNQEGEDFYSKHIAALNAAGILTNTDPTIQEMRGWVMLMMYRSSQNLEEIAKVAAEIGATDEEVEAGKKAAEILAEEEAKEAQEATTGDVAEAPAAQEQAEATTGDVAEAPAVEEQAPTATGDIAEAPAVEETASAEANTGEVAAEPSNN